MADETNKPKTDAKARLDAFIAKVAADPNKPQDTLLLTGFLGASSEPDHTRVYLDETLEDYIDIANSDIVHTEPLPKEQSPLGGAYIWVKKDADVVFGKAGGERRKAKFLEGPISAQATGMTGAAGGAGAAGAAGGFGGAGAAGGAVQPHTIPFFICHPTVLIQACRSHLPQFCPPTPFHPYCPPTPFHPYCPPTPFHPFCPPTPLHPFCPPVTINPQQCQLASAACAQGPGVEFAAQQFGGGQAGMEAAGGFGAVHHSALCPSVVCQTLQVNCPRSVFWPCPSVPVWRCFNTHIFACQHTILEPHCFQVQSIGCPIPTPGCPFGPGGPVGPGPQFQQAQAGGFAGAPQFLPITQVPHQCITQATACFCPTPHGPACPTVFCTQVGCPSVHGFHCPSVQGFHCPTPHCPTPHCPTAVCTEIGPHCNPTPNPVHCPTPNDMCPAPSHFGCPSVGEICPTSSPLFCFGGQQQFGAVGQAAGVQQLHATQFLSGCLQSVVICPHFTQHGFHCGPSQFPVFCPTRICPIPTFHCPPQQSIACGPGGGGFNPGF